VQIISSDTSISPSDRAFNYGDGVFSTLCVENSKVQLLSYHVNRLVHDASAIGVVVEASRLEEAINKEVVSLKNADTASKYVLKVHISAGIGGRGYARSKASSAQIRFSFHPFPDHYAKLSESGMRLICAETTLAIQPRLAGVKHMNRLEQVLVKQEVDFHDVDDAIVCDTQDNVVEASAGNLFFYLNDSWFTPSLKGSGVNGVVRQCLIQALLNDNQTLNVGEYGLEQCKGAQCLVVTNALMGVMPVSSVIYPNGDVIKYPVDSAPYRQLNDLLVQQIQNES
jgi:4-amino-4-deoxychorismate lyase